LDLDGEYWWEVNNGDNVAAINEKPGRFTIRQSTRVAERHPEGDL